MRKQEIVPVVGDTLKPETLREVVLACSVIVDAVGYGPGVPHSPKDFFDYVVKLKGNVNPNFKTLYIFTSGIMIYATGDRVDFPLDESFNPQPRDPLEMIPKKAIEDHILSSTAVRPVVIRPGFVYGGHGGPIASLFFRLTPQAIQAPDMTVWGSLDKRWSWVHLDDLSDGYVRVAHAGSVVDGQVFNLAAQGDNPTFGELKCLGARLAGWKGAPKDIKAVPVPESEGRVQNWEWNVVINPKKAQELLGWAPKHLGVTCEMELYYHSWKAFL
uniref:NAD-dependent epimerase/dehydratase domain-containing protein n=1 Tax=Arcella intermedia TaxID=1963864 RepID=A0A6B2LAS4_9EUKA